MKKILLVCTAMLTLAIMAACKNETPNPQEIVVKEEPTDSPAWDEIYSYRDSISIHDLLIRTLEDTLFYEYAIHSFDDYLNPVVYAGQAILKDGDSEIDEDENGIAYLVDEYVSDGKEYLAFRFDADSHKIVRIVMDDEIAAKCNVTMPIVLFPHEFVYP